MKADWPVTRLIPFLLALACLPTDALLGQDRADPREFLGCYALFVGSWTPDIPLGADTIYLTPPTLVRLTDRLAPGGRGGWEVRALMRPNDRLRFASWARVDEEMRLSWSNGFSGLRVSLTRRGATWVGDAESFWDFDREAQRAPVEALSVPCPS